MLMLSETRGAHIGYSQYVMTIQPANEGVLLRRRLDYGIGNQNAEVFVDGARVGSWYRAGSNFQRWRNEPIYQFTNLPMSQPCCRTIRFV